MKELKVPTGFTKATVEEVSTKGVRDYYPLQKGDVITVSNLICKRDRKDTTGKTFTVYYVMCEINGKERCLPCASFRRFPAEEVEDFLSSSPVMRELYSGSDADRMQFLADKTLIVKDIVPGKAVDWDNRTDDNKRPLKDSKFAVFDFKE